MRHRFALPAALFALLIGSAALAADGPTRLFAPVQNGPTGTATAMPQWAPDRLLVQFTVEGLQRASLPNPGDKSAQVATRTGLASLDQAMTEVGATSLRAAFPDAADKMLAESLGTNRWYIFELSAGADVEAAARRLQVDGFVTEAVPELLAFPATTPNDPLHSNNWGHNNTAQLPGLDWGGTYDHTLGTTVGTPGFDSNAHSAWAAAQGYGNSGVVIAILDSGVDSTHPDLLQVTGYDFGDNDNNPNDNSAQPGHGTACAGVAAAIANNGLGVAGIAGGCSIMPVKVASNNGTLGFTAITNGIYYAADNGADVISMSFGAATTAYAPTDAAISYAYNLGVTLLAATGNENASQVSYPAYNTRVIGVGAASPCGDRKRSSSSSGDVNPGVSTDPNGYTCDGERWWGSSFGPAVQDHQGAVDIIAPTILPTTDIQGSGGYAAGNYSSFFNGTSCATPYAAGVCALIISANPTFTPTQVRAQLVGTAQDVVNIESGAGWDRYTGYGMVDAAAAVNATVIPGAVAAFAASDTVGCAPFDVTFTDQSTGAIDTWIWDFGDGSFSANQSPVHSYTSPGVYTVSLSITGPDGDSDVTKLNHITVGTVPAVSFTSSATFIAAGQGVDFTDTSTGGAYAWSWDFGDGGSSTDQNASHVFNTPGVFAISLTATNDCGPGVGTVPNMIIVTPPPAPVAAFSFTPTSGCAPLLVDFTDESTGTIADRTWDFGDGGSDTAASPSHTFVAPGSYDVSLIVSNFSGADTMTVNLVVDGPPLAAFTTADSTVSVGQDVTFTDASTGGATAWAWDFGDGGASALPNPVHQYLTPGLYTVSLIATNDCGADTLTVADLVTVAEVPGPVAAFSLSPAGGCAPVEVTFTDESLNGVDSWQWDFGDGASDTLQNPVHVYATPGTFDVSLIVMGAGGADTLTVAAAVVVETPVTASFEFGLVLDLGPADRALMDTSTGNPTSWFWDFGDATTDTLQHPIHRFLADGVYDVTLIVSNACSADTLTIVGFVTISGVSAVGDQVAARFGLGQNYPNPFNPSTTIVYALEKPGHARLEVYDVSGRRVATLVDGDKPSGRHEITWRPQDLASGVYFARLTVGTESDTRRVTLLK